MPNQHTTDHLNRLIHVNREAESNLRHAAEVIKNSELESLFTDYAKQHAKFEAELTQELHRLGATVADSHNPGPSWFASLKSFLTGHSAAALLGSCESGEESAEIVYHDAADDNPSGQTHAVIDKQWKQIQGFRTRLARLVNETKDGVDFQRNE